MTHIAPPAPLLQIRSRAASGRAPAWPRDGGTANAAAGGALLGGHPSLEPTGSAPSSDYDALTDLFLDDGPLGPPKDAARRLTEDRGATAPRPATPACIAVERGPSMVAAHPRAVIEALILGHLPVMGSAWVTQYARHMATERGASVALLKLIAGQASLEIISPDSPDSAIAGSLGVVGPYTTLQAAVAAAAKVDHWVVRADETTEPRLAELERVDRLTLLTGADEVAVLASYRMLKALTHGRPDTAEDAGGPEIKLGVMGAAADKAEDAGRRLQAMSQRFLNRDVELAACVQRMAGARTVPLFRGATEASLEELLGTLDAARARVSGEAALEGTPQARPASIPTIMPEAVVPQGVPTSPRLTASPAPMRAAVGRIAGLLTGHVPGLRTLEARCPYAEEVELAAGADGTLHLLARAAGEQERDAVESLVAAAAWARAHGTLLTLACAGAATVDGSRRPVMHLLTERAREVRRLLDADLRVHLLAPVEVEGRAGWFCTELN
jgi:hypothetical protein